ncbi:MAG: ABC-2 family transporter protein [Candidatus Poribacteria bacterium]|nr:ABC-2 family transporter protein [Candidatus Poribacteria bacterium]
MRVNTLHKYWKTTAIAAAEYVGNNLLFLMDYLLRFLRVTVLLSIWRVILASKGEVSGMTLESVLTYTLISEVFSQQLAPRVRLDVAIWEGSIATRFLRPIGIFGQFTAEMVGRWIFGFCIFSLPLLLVAPILGVNPLPVSVEAAGLFVFSLALAISVGLALEFAYGALMVALEHNLYTLDMVRNAIGMVLSGALLPLALLPWGLGEIFAWLPFASMASAPLQIYTGTGDPFWLVSVQFGWSIILWPLAYGLWRKYREKLVSHGG